MIRALLLFLSEIREKSGRIREEAGRKQGGSREGVGGGLRFDNATIDGILNKKVCDEGISIANEIIERCAVIQPQFRE